MPLLPQAGHRSALPLLFGLKSLLRPMVNRALTSPPLWWDDPFSYPPAMADLLKVLGFS